MFELRRPASGSVSSRDLDGDPRRGAAARAKRWNEDEAMVKRQVACWAAAAFWLAAAAVAMVGFCEIAAGQGAVAAGAGAKPVAGPPKYKIAKVPDAVFEPSNVQRMQSAVAPLARGNAEVDARLSRAYFGLYLPGLITNPVHAVDANAAVESLRKMQMQMEMRGEQAPIDKFNDLVFRAMGRVAADNYYPPARVMAITTIGLLNQKPISLTDQRPPEPYAAALPQLFRWATAESEPDGVRAAALSGLRRHLTLSKVPPRVASAIAGKMQALIEQPRPETRSADGHAYLQRLAVDILRSLSGERNKAFATRLVSIAADADQHDLIALHSAGAIGQMPATTLAGSPQLATPQPMLLAWSKRVLDVMEGESQRLALLNRRKQAPSQPRAPESYLEKREEADAQAATRRGAAGGMGAGMNGNMGGGMDMAAMMESMNRGGGGGGGQMGGGMNDEMMRSMMMGGMGGMGGFVPKANPQPPEVIAARKKINYAIESLHAAATGNPQTGQSREAVGLASAAGEQQKRLIMNWSEQLDELATTLNQESLDTKDKFVEVLDEQIEQLAERLNLQPAVKLAVEQPGDAGLDGVGLDGGGLDGELNGGGLNGDGLGGDNLGGGPAVDPLAGDGLGDDPLGGPAPADVLGGGDAGLDDF